MVYGWLIDRVTDSTIQGLTNWLIDLWLVDWQTSWLYCLGTDQLTEWLMAGCLKEKLTPLSWNWPNNWMIYGSFIDRITDSTVRTDQLNWLYCPETDQLTEWLMVGWLIGWLTDSTVRRLTNTLNDYFIAVWLTNKPTLLSEDWQTYWMLTG